MGKGENSIKIIIFVSDLLSSLFFINLIIVTFKFYQMKNFLKLVAVCFAVLLPLSVMASGRCGSI